MPFENLQWRRKSPFIPLALFILLVNLVLLHRYIPGWRQVQPAMPYLPPLYGIPSARPSYSQRKFVSPTVDQFLEQTASKMNDTDLAMLLQNTFPNTLDTTIEWFLDDPKPRTFLITGDIPAMWIRDSTNQIMPYLRFAKEDERIRRLILGVISVQSSYLYYDPYANAFLKPWDAPLKSELGRSHDSVTPAYDPNYVWESKYELDSLSHFFQLVNEYMDATGDVAGVVQCAEWIKAVPRVLRVIDDQMRGTWQSASHVTSMYSGAAHRPFERGQEPLPLSLNEGYRFQRVSDRPTETLGADGLGGISRACGLVRSAFRPSDDATVMPYLIPANAHLSINLQRLAKHVRNRDATLSADAKRLGDTIRRAIYKHAVVEHAKFGKIFAYEVDCYGSQLLMDDANTPSLLSLPLLGFVDVRDSIYQNTRAFILSSWNPWYFSGTFASGVGGPHTGRDMIWPMSLLVQIQTAISESEVATVLDVLKRLSRHSGLMCESFHKNQPGRSTRPWFSWANGLAGTTILHIIDRFPQFA